MFHSFLAADRNRFGDFNTEPCAPSLQGAGSAVDESATKYTSSGAHCEKTACLNRNRPFQRFSRERQSSIPEPSRSRLTPCCEASLRRQRYGKPIDVDADGRNRDRLRRVADRDLFHFHLRRLAHTVERGQALSCQQPQL